MTEPSRQIPVQPPSVLLMGAPGAGKTYALTTFLEAGIELFVLALESNVPDSLYDSLRDRNLPVEKLHYHTIKVAAPSIEELQTMANEVKTKNFQQLSDTKGIAKDRMTHWTEMLSAVRDFPDDRTGKTFGATSSWGADRAFAIDGTSGLNTMAFEYTVGLKPNMAPGDYGTAQALEHSFLRSQMADRGCFFVLIAHPDRGVEEISQATKIMPQFVGNKLAPKVMKDFSEIVYAKQLITGTGMAATASHIWATIDPGAELKHRALAASPNLPASFVPLVEAHRKRLSQNAKPAVEAVA